MLAVAVLATAGAAGQQGQYTENPCIIDRGATWLTRSAPMSAAARRAQAYAAMAAVLKVVSARPEPAGRQEP